MRCMVTHDLKFAHTPATKREFLSVLESSSEASSLLNAIVETAEIFQGFAGYKDAVRKDQHVFNRLVYWEGVTKQVANQHVYTCGCDGVVDDYEYDGSNDNVFGFWQ